MLESRTSMNIRDPGPAVLKPSHSKEKESQAMATAAQIEANRRNAQKSTGPRTEEGKNRSRLNSLDHGCRANILVLPTEDFAEYESQLQAWKFSLQPRNPVEETLVERLVSLKWQEKRIDRAHTARLTRRISHTSIEEADREQAEVIELGQKLFRDASGLAVFDLEREGSAPGSRDAKAAGRVSHQADDRDPPLRLVHRLQASLAGCEWLLAQWTRLRELLVDGLPWLAHDKLKAVRLLGRDPIDAIDSPEVAQVYLASHALLNEGRPPFQAILNQLRSEEVPAFESFCVRRGLSAHAPRDAAAARAILLDLIDRATTTLENRAGVFRELAEINAQYAADRLSWDDTPEGERLRRYELTCKRAWQRTFELLLKIRQLPAEPNLSMIPSTGRPLSSAMSSEIDTPERPVANGAIARDEPVERPEPPIEAKSASKNAPNEPNSRERAFESERPDVQKACRIDAPHGDRKPGGIGIAGKTKNHPVLNRVLAGRTSTLLNLSGIYEGA